MAKQERNISEELFDTAGQEISGSVKKGKEYTDQIVSGTFSMVKSTGIAIFGEAALSLGAGGRLSPYIIKPGAVCLFKMWRNDRFH